MFNLVQNNNQHQGSHKISCTSWKQKHMKLETTTNKNTQKCTIASEEHTYLLYKMQENCPRNYIHFLNAQKLEGKY